MKLSPLTALFLALFAAILVVFWIDPMDPSTLSTPFCLGIILMWFSLRQPAWSVFTIAICFCLLDFYATESFLSKVSIHINVVHPYFWFFQRFGLFMVLCVMAVYLSSSREESEKSLSHIQSILGKLPAPVVISDAGGYIIYANEALCSFFNKPANELIGKRYFELLMSNIEEGKATRYYIELFASEDQNAPEVELVTSVSPKSIKATLTCLGTGVHRSMITVLQTSNNGASLASG